MMFKGFVGVLFLSFAHVNREHNLAAHVCTKLASSDNVYAARMSYVPL